jgi:hypothetical protein
MPIETNLLRRGDIVSSSRSREHDLAALATAQHGVVARRQLLARGFSCDEIQNMRASGRLLPLYQGVYAVGHCALSRNGRWMAAVLARGHESLLSHRAGAALSSLRRTSVGYVEVTVPRPLSRVAGIRTYVCTRLQPQDRREIDGIPCTSPALTLLNLAAVLPRRQLERACDEAEVQRLFDLSAIEDVLERFRGSRGAARLRAVLDEHAIGTTLTRRGLEELALQALDRCGVPRPEVNVRLVCRPGVGWEVDFLWRRERLVLETDGARFHSSRAQIERDRRKEADLVIAGYRVLRATYLQVEREADVVAAMVRAAMSARQP